MYNQNKKYQVKQPPNFISFYKRMEEQRNKDLARQASNTDKNKQNQITTRSKSLQNSMINSLVGASTAKKSQISSASASTLNTYSKSKMQPVRSSKLGSKVKMSLNNTNNVFYQDRQQAKLIKNFEIVRPFLTKVLLFLLLAWTGLYFIQPYKGVCPRNADCGVYVHCHHGYKFVNGRCEVTAEVKQQVGLVCQSVIDNLKFQYGSQDCAQGNQKMPSKSVTDILDDYELKSKALQDQLYRWLQDSSKQSKYKFQFRGGQIYPSQKTYTLFCKFQKMVNTRGFYAMFTISVFLLLGLMIWLKVMAQRSRANKIFAYLRQKTIQQNEIIIDISKLEQRFGRIYQVLWQQIDQARIEDKNIAYYQDENLHWKLIQ